MAVCPVHGNVTLIIEEVELESWSIPGGLHGRIVSSSWSCGCMPSVYEDAAYDPFSYYDDTFVDDEELTRWVDEGGA